eukprot:5443341-Prymnesium_polylepis.2
MFWLHHCNVDRQYVPALPPRFASRVREPDGSRGSLQPQPRTIPPPGEPFRPEHTFNTQALGYQYDELVTRQPLRMTEEPTIALFYPVSPQLVTRSMGVYIFVFDKRVDAAKRPRLPKNKEAMLSRTPTSPRSPPSFAGCAALALELTLPKRCAVSHRVSSPRTAAVGVARGGVAFMPIVGVPMKHDSFALACCSRRLHLARPQGLACEFRCCVCVSRWSEGTWPRVHVLDEITNLQTEPD